MYLDIIPFHRQGFWQVMIKELHIPVHQSFGQFQIMYLDIIPVHRQRLWHVLLKELHLIIPIQQLSHGQFQVMQLDITPIQRL